MLVQVLLGQPGMGCNLVLTANGCLREEGKSGEEDQEKDTEFFFTHIAFE